VKRFFILLYLSPCILTLPLTGSGQNTEDVRESLVNNALSEVASLYDRTMKQNSFIYNGRIYRDNFDAIRGHQYFKEESWVNSKMIFEGESFDSVFIMYDIYNDLVLLENYNEKGRLAPIILNSRDITVFYLHDHTFIYLQEDTVLNMPEGIYDELYSESSIYLFAKRSKEIIKTTKWNDLLEDFVENDEYYLKKDGLYHRIKNMKSFLKVFKDRKKRLKIYIRKNNLNYLESFEEALIKIIAYNETL